MGYGLTKLWGRGLVAVLAITVVVAALAGGASAQLTTVGPEWGIPTSGSQPGNLAVDASGSVWFTEIAGNKIGRINPNGVFAEFDVSTANSQPWGIVLDAGGRIWFTEFAGNKIGNMAPGGGNMGQDNIPTNDSQPTGITVDGSGNIWFVESKGNKIGRFIPSNSQFNEWDIPTSNSQPWAIAVDPSGNVWFAERNGNKLGKMAPNAQFSEYGIPTSNSQPTGIAVDAAGNIWFAEYDGNKIGKAIATAPVSTATPVPTATSVLPTLTPMPTPLPAARDNRYFGQTGYRVDNDVFWDYFNKRGGINAFGFPVSRTFTFLGFTTQFFQRSILQIGPDGSARTMNMLDPGLMPYTRINGSTFPAPDQSMAELAPRPGTPDYGVRVQEFIRNYSPNQFEGLTVNFYQAFQNTVKLQDAFPFGGANPDLLPLLNLELWGVPTSRPAYEPNNRNFVYLRFQRGIMHFDASNGATQGLLLADYLKDVITGVNLPGDLDAQANGSPFYRQYNPNKVNWVDRPDQLSATNLAFAFEKQ